MDQNCTTERTLWIGAVQQKGHCGSELYNRKDTVDQSCTTETERTLWISTVQKKGHCGSELYKRKDTMDQSRTTVTERELWIGAIQQKHNGNRSPFPSVAGGCCLVHSVRCQADLRQPGFASVASLSASGT